MRRLRSEPCIYIATNLINGKQYVGQTIAFKRRLDEHLRATVGFGAAIKKYGIENFSFHRIRMQDSELDEWEQFYIRVLGTRVPNGYNIQVGTKASGWKRRENKKLQCSKDIWRRLFEAAEAESETMAGGMEKTFARLKDKMLWVYQ